MKRNQKAVVERLKDLYAKKGENHIFAKINVDLPGSIKESIRRKAAGIDFGTFPDVRELFPLWEDYLTFFDKLEDDWLPALYPRQYDQGLFGVIFGAEMEVNHVDGPGWSCSMTRAFDHEGYRELLHRIARPDPQWLERMEEDFRYLAEQSRDRWGVAVPITVDALNFAMQLRGNQALLDFYDCPDDLKQLLQEAVRINIELVEKQRHAIDMDYAGGVYDFFNGGWLPQNGIPMSVDSYNMCRAELYSEFGLPYQQQLIDHFGSANFHVHGNGRHLLPELAELKGCVVSLIADDGSDIRAIDDLENIKELVGPVIPVIQCHETEFRTRLSEKSLVGGTYYLVSGIDALDNANRLMDDVRTYRV